MVKNFEADQKRLRAIMLNFDEKKPDMSDAEKDERQELITMMKDAFSKFKQALNEQTARMERGAGGAGMDETADSELRAGRAKEHNETQ